MDSDTSSKNHVLVFAESHPQLLLGAVIGLVIIIVIMILYWRGWFGGEKMTDRKPRRTRVEVDELDELIESIHQKQRRG